jgi:hypothetical protein
MTPDTPTPTPVSAPTPDGVTCVEQLLHLYAVGVRDFSGAILEGARLEGATLRDADLSYADLSYADLRYADLRGANLRGARLKDANLRRADVRGARLEDADLSGADLTNALLSRAHLAGANLEDAILRGADLAGVSGLLDPIAWLERHCERDADGLVVYKLFNTHSPAQPSWTVEPGAILSETVNPDPATSYGSGINVATRAWHELLGIRTVWRCRIRWLWLAGVVVPYATNGVFRTGRLELLEQVRLPSAGSDPTREEMPDHDA